MPIRKTFELSGVVQGIGLRPTLFRLAHALGLGGSVCNRTGSVQLVLEGSAADIAAFMKALPTEFPTAGRLDAIREVSRETPRTPPSPFVILPSQSARNTTIQIPPDLRMCPDCRRELFEPANRRFGYPFTTCTLCGPRYTVVEAMPYDRERTTLRRFPLCEDCRREYSDPADRRFHAESTACPVCGPSAWFETAVGERPAGGDHPIALARKTLHAGSIMAVRGIGGFLLAVDALNRDALTALRARKARPHKPLAVMARDTEAASAFCQVDAAAARLLTSPAGPIVILPIAPGAAAAGLPHDLLSPDTETLGVMLPTSPLHALLMQPLPGDPVPAFELLVMTSGNRRGEPICLTNAEARERLADIADGFLLHNREINLRNDDSVCVIRNGAPQAWRRARGFAPDPLLLTRPLRRAVLAMGADMKNSVAIGRANRIVLSPHVGDLDTPEALASHRQVAETLPRFLDIAPECVAVDLHPDMRSTRSGEALAAALRLPLRRIQHHHAHAMACLTEHGEAEGLALVFDGTGYGPDGHIWGAELLAASAAGFRRLATFAPVPLPGGEAAIRQPLRQFAARCAMAGIAYQPRWRETLGLDETAFQAWSRQAVEAIQAPPAHAAGRLLDAVAVATGHMPFPPTYDGQAPIRLEAAARRAAARGVSTPVLPFSGSVAEARFTVDWSETFRRVVELVTTGEDPDTLALAMHRAIASAAEAMLIYALDREPSRVVALSGGVFMNAILSEAVSARASALGLRVLQHGLISPGDGCIALGQAVIGGSE